MKRLIIFVFAVICTSFTVYGADIQDIKQIEIGTSKEEIYSIIGVGECSSSGLKETYDLSDGTTAVLQYSEGVLVRGYITE